MKKIYVQKNNTNITLVNYILKKFPKLPRSFLYKALRNKDIKVNGKRISKDIDLNDNDILEIYISDNILFNEIKKIEIIYKDENILIVFKPQGILSNNTITDISNEKTMEDLVKLSYPNAMICHRLDRNTSGLLIFALNELSYNEILNAFKNGLISKEYVAYVYGCNFKKNKESLISYILKDSKTGFSKIYTNKVLGSKKILTDYEVIYTDKNLNYSVLKIIIHTGKTHQIRAQMLNISHPIIGDSKYGKNEINNLFKIYKQLLFAVKYSFKFKDDNFLHYLNNISIKLDENKYNKKLGSDFNEIQI